MTRLAFILLAVTAFAADDSPSGTRMTPPTLREISPLGMPRGGTFELTINGYNLAKASAIYFSDPSVTAAITRIRDLTDQDDVRLGGNGTPLTIDLGPLPVRSEITADLKIAPNAPLGPVRFRVLTPLGLSPQGTVDIEPYWGEAGDKEPNDTITDATLAGLPAILVGAISKPGDVDYYKIEVKDGEQLVFEDDGRMLGSSLQNVMAIEDSKGDIIAQHRDDGTPGANTFAHKFDKAGTYYVRISDYQESGSGKHFYRVKVGAVPIVLSAFPLGVQQGKTAEVTLTGYNLAAKTVTVTGEPNEGDLDARMLRISGTHGDTVNKLRVAIGQEPESTVRPVITSPMTVNGRLTAPKQDFRFHARKGEKLVFEVNAARLGSPLDSQLEILTPDGKPVERALARATEQTSLVLRDHDSASQGLRLDSAAGLKVGDYMMVGTEIVRITRVPNFPDEDTIFEGFGGRRAALFDTTPEAHGMDSPAYKVEIHELGAKLPNNGLPLVHLLYKNDDGGPGYGKDSLLHFTAPADGDYLVRLSDVRGLKGEDYTYRLTIRAPRPDYRLSFSPRNPNVPASGRIPLTVTALRLDDFNGPINVVVKDLPPGVHATTATIQPGQIAATLTLSADANATSPAATPFRVVDDKGREVNAEDHLKLLAVIPRADVDVTAETHEVSLVPGGHATIEISISRNNGFAGRVPLAIRDLPPSVRVIDVGLNGVLVNETETKRSFTLEALPDAQPLDQPIYISGDIETRAGGQQTAFLSQPITLHLKHDDHASATR